MNEWHEHPADPKQKVYGEKLSPGTRIQKGDRFASIIAGATWAETAIAGKSVSHIATYVRPAKALM